MDIYTIVAQCITSMHETQQSAMEQSFVNSSEYSAQSLCLTQNNTQAGNLNRHFERSYGTKANPNIHVERPGSNGGKHERPGRAGACKSLKITIEYELKLRARKCNEIRDYD